MLVLRYASLVGDYCHCLYFGGDVAGRVFKVKAPPQYIVENQPITPSETPQTAQDFIFVKTEYKLRRVSHADILYVEGGKDYIRIHTPKERILSLMTLTKIQEMLPSPQFSRVQKSWLVPINKIDSVERQRIFIGKTIIPIGDTYKDDFMKILGG